jgi:dynein heavy chain, axonemal
MWALNTKYLITYVCVLKWVPSVLQVLERSKSSYLPPFLNLRSLIQHEAAAAEDNVKFLLVLEEPCKVLAAASPEAIPAALPRILHCVRLIWNLSRFYSVPDHITGLLRKVRCLCPAGEIYKSIKILL